MFCIQNEKDVIDKFIIFFAAKIIFSTKLKSDTNDILKKIFENRKMKQNCSVKYHCSVKNSNII